MMQPEELQMIDIFSSISFNEQIQIGMVSSNSEKSSSELLAPNSNSFNDTTFQDYSSEFSDNEIPSRKNISNSKRKYFTKYEDSLLVSAAMKYKQENWNTIAKCVPGRTPKQCRDRWANYLKPSLHFGPWTDDEDQLLVSLVNQHGTHWTMMKSHFPDRSANCLKNRWYWLLKNNVRVMTLDRSIPSLVNSNSGDNIPNQSNMPEINEEKFDKHNITKKNCNNNIDDNHDPNNPSINSQQNQNYKNYYCLIKRGKKRKNSSQKKDKSRNFYSKNQNHGNIKKIIEFNYNLQENTQISDGNDLITFDPDELNW